jgi:Fe-S cluster biogenesis protein NfuA
MPLGLTGTTVTTAGFMRSQDYENLPMKRPQIAQKMSDANTLHTMQVQAPISIKAETAIADPDTCKFTVSTVVQAGGPFFFTDAVQAASAPLATTLFELPGVTSVLIADNIVTVSKSANTEWQTLKAAIGAAIRAQLLSGAPAVLATAVAAQAQGRSTEVVREIVQDILDREINRSIASHGGAISIVDLREGQLYVRMSGGCQGCASSEATLKQGFEVMVKRAAPEITEIIDVTDHQSGQKPYYSR